MYKRNKFIFQIGVTNAYQVTREIQAHTVKISNAFNRNPIVLLSSPQQQIVSYI